MSLSVRVSLSYISHSFTQSISMPLDFLRRIRIRLARSFQIDATGSIRRIRVRSLQSQSRKQVFAIASKLARDSEVDTILIDAADTCMQLW
jgi:hypothetical protein